MFLLSLTWTVSCVGTEPPKIAGDQLRPDSQGKVQTTYCLLGRGLINCVHVNIIYYGLQARLSYYLCKHIYLTLFFVYTAYLPKMFA